ncbi:MAG: hypothetical protein R3Y63_04675 [Eubacteriales bacterium]
MEHLPKKQEIANKMKELYQDGGMISPVMDLAKYIITKCTIDEKPVNHDDLQIMLYLLQKEALQHIGLPLHDGIFQAWEQGPMVLEIHDHYSSMGYIRQLCTDIGNIKGKSFVDEVMSEAEKMKLMGFHHASIKPDGAWHEIWSKHREEHLEIPIELIQEKG